MTAAAIPFRLGPLPGKGVAVIATAPICAGTLLFAESPLMLLSPHDGQSSQSSQSGDAPLVTTTRTPHEARVLARFWSCGASQRQAILALCSNLSCSSLPVVAGGGADGGADGGGNRTGAGVGGPPTADTVALGVWKVNNFCLDAVGTVNGVFELASRLNHACVGGDNCRWEWDGRGPGTVAFWTVRDVAVCSRVCLTCFFAEETV